MAINLADLGVFAVGEDIRFTVTDSQTDLTGRAPVIIEASRGIAGRITVSMTNPSGGVFSVHIEGTDPIRAGDYVFRVQLNGDGLDSLVYPFKLRLM